MGNLFEASVPGNEHELNFRKHSRILQACLLLITRKLFLANRTDAHIVLTEKILSCFST